MIPNFALSLSFEGISLLRRMGPRWARIDDVSLDHDDFDSQVIALRDRAESLDPTGAQVALIIPNEQIRYLDQPDLGGDDIARDVAIRAALDGATPYAVTDLRFDHVVTDGRLQIAAVAVETLDEAQSFAAEHGFEPVCFLAQAPDGAFDGAVFFGKAKGWNKAATRPGRAIQIVPADEAALRPLPKPELADDPAPKSKAPPAAPAPASTPATTRAAPAPTPAPPPEAPSAEAPADPAESPARPAAPVRPKAPAVEAPRAAATGPKAPPVPPMAPAAPATKAPEAAPPPRPTPPAPEPKRAADTPTAEAVEPRVAADAEAPVRFSTIRASRGEAPVPDAPSGSLLSGTVKPRFTPVPPAPKAAPDAPVQPPAGTDAPEKPRGKSGFFAKPTATDLLERAAAAVDQAEAERSRKAPAKAKLPTGPGAAPEPPAPPAPQGPEGDGTVKPPKLPPKTRPKPKAPKPIPKTAAARAAGLAATPGREAKEDEFLAPPIAARDAHAATVPKAGPKPNPLAKLAALRGPQGGGTGGPALAGAGAPAATLPPGMGFTSSSERDRMTIFGARDRDMSDHGPRRLGLILTAVLLLFLAGIAAWAAVFLDDGLARLFRSGDDAPASAVASLPDGTDAPAPAPGAPDSGVVLESAAPTAGPAPTAATRPVARPDEDLQLAAFDASAPDTAVQPLAVPVDPRQLTREEAAVAYAASGVWQRAPVEPRTPPADGVEDIYAASIDPDIQIFDAVALPDVNAFGREPDFADPGLPPPAGLTFDFDERDLVRATPEGALSPEGLRIFTGRPPAIPPLRGETALVSPDGEVLGSIRTRLNSMPRIRPQVRPSDIIEQRERSQLRGVTRSELASLRPVLRPQTVQERAEIDSPEATDQAVRASLVPVARPRNMAAIVDQADRSLNSAAPAAPVQTAAAVAPRTIAPSVPSSASVARSATLPNAINLNRINLIGVYGTSENRRALVRLPNGKYQKVKVGDRLDGGQVTAIGDEELRYSKGGRNLTLEMPRG